MEEVRDANGKLENVYVRVRLPFSYYSISVTADFPLTQVDRSLVLSKGKSAVAKLLIELQVLKSTADGKGAREFYNKLTKPIQGWEGEIRDIVLRKKLVRFLIFYVFNVVIIDINNFLFFQPRKIFVQPNTILVDDKVVLKEYPHTPSGVIQSFVERNL